MPKSLKLLLVAGARPNFMKIAPIIWAIRSFNGRFEGGAMIRYLLVHTGQHYDEKMSDIFFKELNIPKPRINLDVGSGSHAKQTAEIMMGFEPICLREKPDWVVVVGDVNSTLACTLVATKLGLKVAHVEAGLRSFDRTMPEEINRIVTDSLANLLLTPSPDANENLRNEGVTEARIRFVGNIMIDALVANLDKAGENDILERMGLKQGDFVYVTLHRPSNVDAPDILAAIMRELSSLAERLPVVFPVHPRTMCMFREHHITLDKHNGLRLLDPIGYHESLRLTQQARLVLTDSGGLQEESTFLQVPCLTLRPNTERPITIAQGTNKLTCLDNLATDIDEILQNRRMHCRVPEYWDGHTAERIIAALLDTR